MRTLTSLFFLLCEAFSYGAEPALYEGRFETRSTGIFLPVSVQGKECMFLFDTGASLVVLDKKFKTLLGEELTLEEIQARTGTPFFNGSALTPNGELELELYQAIPMRLAKLQVANKFPYMLADLQALWPFSGVEFCGILGTSFLHQFRWEISFNDGVIKAYIGAEPFEGDYSSKASIFWSKANIPYVSVDVSGREIAFDIDLGDNGSGRMTRENLLFLKRNEEVIKTHTQEVITISSLSKSEEFRLHALHFGDAVYPDIVMQESEQNALGLAFFKRHDIVLDFPFDRLYLQRHEDYDHRQELDKSGIRVIQKENRLIVFSISPLAGASIGDIKKGDEIISLNGVQGPSLYTMREALRAKEGTELSVRLRRDGAVNETRVVLGKDPLQ